MHAKVTAVDFLRPPHPDFANGQQTWDRPAGAGEAPDLPLRALRPDAQAVSGVSATSGCTWEVPGG